MDVSPEMERKEATKDGTSSPEMETFLEQKEKPFHDGLGSRLKFWTRKRYIIVVMTVFGEFTKSILRSNLSIAVFPMTENHTETNGNGTVTYVQDFDWDVKTRGFLLSVFYYGYIATNIPGGILAIKYGGGRLYGVGIILTSVTTLITPVAARAHLYLLIAVRVFEGMSEGVLSASLELLLSSWIPVQERSSCVAVILTGSNWGHIASVAASSAIGFHWRWEAIFYCTGSVGVLWFAAWLMLVKEHPELDKKISISELRYIRQFSRMNQPLNKVNSIPYMKIMTSMPVCAFIIAHIAGGWCFALSVMQSPAYIKAASRCILSVTLDAQGYLHPISLNNVSFHHVWWLPVLYKLMTLFLTLSDTLGKVRVSIINVLKLSYHNSGYLSTLPFIINVLAIYFMSPIADILTTKKVLSVTVARKVYISGSLVTMALFSFLIQHASSMTMVIICLTVILTFATFTHVEAMVNVLDIAPRYSSVLAGMLTTSFSLCGMLAPTVIGFLTQNKTAEEWHTVFSIQAGICLVAALVYSVFASGELQPWATDTSHQTSSPEQDVDQTIR